MLISFIGSPCSGKTTTAAMLFSKLKEGGLPVEFLGEYARLYIAERRLSLRAEGVQKLTLTDQDQMNILVTQAKQEILMNQSLEGIPGGVVVSDTSCLNSLLYMSPEQRQSPKVREWIRIVMKSNYLTFYCKPVDIPSYQKALDPNRVHSQEESQAIDQDLPEILKNLDVGDYTMLIGSTEARLSRAYQAVNSQLKNLLARTTVSS